MGRFKREVVVFLKESRVRVTSLLKGKRGRKVVQFVIFTLVFILCLNSLRNRTVNKTKRELAEKVVYLLYDFGTTEQLEEQQIKLKRYVTASVYNELTVDNEQRRLNTYLKFYDEASTVNVITSTGSYVIYSLDTPAISDERRFIFCYSVNRNGKICKVREAELIDFMEGSD